MFRKLNAIVNRRYLFLLFMFLPTIVMSQLHADFSATPLSGCAPAVINFTDNSAGNPTSWMWDFGNGSVSDVQTPIATILIRALTM